MKWFSGLIATVLISGCSTLPSDPDPHAEKFTFQVVGVEIPSTDVDIMSPDFDKILEHPDAEITEYPIVMAGNGESVTNDQTTAVSLPEDYDIVDGKAVAKESIQKIGHLVAITVDEVKDEVIRYHLKLHDQKLMGYDEYNVEGGITVEMPLMETRGINTQLAQTPNTWVTMGGLVEETSDGTKMTQCIGVRIIPPAE